MNKKRYSITILSILLIFSISCSPKLKKENPYNLKLTSNISEYKKQIALDSNHVLIDIEKFIPSIVLDIRYASKNNFTKQKLYKSPKAFVRKPVAEQLLKIQNELHGKGIGIKIFDAYRPYSVTLKFYNIYKDTNFVAAPWSGSSHNTGCAVDLTLVDLKTGKELQMPTEFDDFSEKASHLYSDLPIKVILNRKLLLDIMLKYGFVQYDQEWWHYRHKDSANFELLNLSFEELK